MEVKELAKYLEDSVKWLLEEDMGCTTLKLDDRLAVCVGWLPGYGEEKRDDVIQSPTEPDFAINAGIKVWTSDDMRTDYEFINMPYYDNGDVLQSDVSIEPDENYEELAKWLLSEYEQLKDLEIEEDGRIVEKPEEQPKEESCEKCEAKLNELDDGDVALFGHDDDETWKKDIWRFVYKLKGEDKEHVEHKDFGDWGGKELPFKEEDCEYWYLIDIRNPNWGPFASYPNPLPKEVKVIKESCKKEPLKETWAGEDVIKDLTERAQMILEEGADESDAIWQAIDEGLIYTKDIYTLMEHYGSIETSTIIESFYDDLYNDIAEGLEEPEEEAEESDDYEPRETKWDGDLED